MRQAAGGQGLAVKVVFDALMAKGKETVSQNQRFPSQPRISKMFNALSASISRDEYEYTSLEWTR